MSSAPASAAAERRHDLDWLRVAAFMLLMLYHLGMFYVPWGWHVKSTHIEPGLEPWMGALNPWRLTLLFIISGAATRFMWKGQPRASLAGQRSLRLLIPLLFGMIFIVAPQSWAEVVEKNGYTGNFLDFWVRYLSFDQSFGIILPTYNHLWFVAYLWLYTMVVLIAGQPLLRAERPAGRLLSGAGLFLIPALLFGLYRAAAFRAWGESHIIVDDPYAHLHYGTAFLLGFFMARNDAAWALLVKTRIVALAAAIVIFAIAMPLSYVIEDSPGWPGFAFAFLREAYAWAAICALFGFARRHITKGSKLLTTLTEAVFPFYIIHQTTIVLAGHFLRDTGLNVWTEAAIILTVTALSCLATYALALTVPWLRLPLGLKPR